MLISRRILVLTCLLLTLAAHADAQGIITFADRPEGSEGKPYAWLPFGFYSQAFDLAAGVGAASLGVGQPQLGLAGAVFGSTNSSYGFLGSVTRLQIRPVNRLFLDAKIAYLNYTNLQSYVPGNPDFTDERAGSNESTFENFLQTPGRDGFAYLEFRYLLPIGGARDEPIASFVLEDGLLKSGATGGWSWNPAKSGRTYVGVEAFFRDQVIEDEIGDRIFSTNGLSLSLEHDNTDFRLNPARGSQKILQIRRDFGGFDSSGVWTTVELDWAKYISLGAGKHTRQRVLAFNFWTIDAPSWERSELEHGTPLVSGAPPYFEGSRLGGLYRFRGYRAHRFWDKSAIYYSAEFRFIPKRSPLDRFNNVAGLNLSWWQLVVFAEVGRVAPDWSLSELHEDMKWDAGFGLRTIVRRTRVRFDVGFSPESWQMWFMAGQAF
jgi:hypothetical protein